jgi:hypothetical protein
LFPYITGEDLNSEADPAGKRWIVDFYGLSEEESARYSVPYARVLESVKPVRDRKPKAVRDAPWWLFLRTRPALRKAISGLDEVVAIAVVSKTVMPMRVPTGQVFSNKIIVFATASYSEQAILSSGIHQAWVIKYTATMRTDVSYSPSDVFLTFPRPKPTERLEEAGRTLDNERREIMMRRDLGLTRLYNLVNDPDYIDEDIDRMRAIHVELDKAAGDAYGWDAIELDHGFHTYRKMQRWTVSPDARVEILDRLLEENLRRAAAQGEAPPPAEDEDEGDDE